MVLGEGDVPPASAQVSSDPWLDRERVREVVNEVARPVVLVGHLVYLTAVMPGVDLGETHGPRFESWWAHSV